MLCATLAEHGAAATTASIAFGDAVKDEVAALYNIPRALCDTQEGKKTEIKAGTTIRDLLILHSAQRKVEFTPSYWAEIVAKRIQANMFVENWIIHDWRYMAELNTLVSTFPQAHVYTIRVRRKGVIPLTDPSEHQLDLYETQFIVDNDGDLRHLRPILETLVSF
jgi:hypothetical protein